MKANIPKKLWTAPEVVQTVLKDKQLISFSIQIFYMYYVIAVYYVYFFIIIIIK